MNFTEKQAKVLDNLLVELYNSSSVSISIFEKGFSPNERDTTVRTLVDDGYAEILIHREGGTVYSITQQGRQFCRRGGYRQPFREVTRATINQWIDRLCGFLSGAVVAWVLTHLFCL